MRKNWEIPLSPNQNGELGRIGKAGGRTPMMHERGKSDGPIVPTKRPNKAMKVVAEAVEGRGPAKGNTDQQNASRTQSRTGDVKPPHDAPSALDRVRRAARRDRKLRFTALFHHITIDLLRSSFYAIKRRAAPGIDGVTWEQYEKDLENSLKELHGRLHQGAYRAKPTRRVFIEKADGRQRALGLAALEDKIVQRATAEILHAIYEVDFLGFSYGFRPGRGQHDALDALAVGIHRKKVSWVLECDIRGFFDAIDHEWMQRFVEHRIGDRRILRLIQKWLRAGVIQDGKRMQTRVGTPQGATISPLLANVYLHYVFDLWAHAWRKKRTSGDMIIVRYADDIIVGFQKKSDANKFRHDLQQRLQGFGLELHPEKTRLVQFGKLAADFRKQDGKGRPETFDFLGFTHICGKSKRGKFLLHRRTIKKRMRASLRAIRSELMRRRHLPIPDQGRWLNRIVRGHYAYYGVPTNIHRMESFRDQVTRHWRHALMRRSQRHRLDWDRMRLLAERWIPKAHIQHPWPNVRFDARTRGRSPVR